MASLLLPNQPDVECGIRNSSSCLSFSFTSTSINIGLKWGHRAQDTGEKRGSEGSRHTGHAETRATCGARRKQQGNYPAICCNVRREPKQLPPREPDRTRLCNCNLETRVAPILTPPAAPCLHHVAWCHFYVVLNFFAVMRLNVQITCCFYFSCQPLFALFHLLTSFSPSFIFSLATHTRR